MRGSAGLCPPPGGRRESVQNGLLPFLRGLQNRCDLNEASLKGEAEAITEFTDWDAEDDVEEPFQILLNSYRANDNLTLAGKTAAYGYLLLPLINRLAFIRANKKHPEIFRSPISRPLIIVGMPRTGTTFLHHLFSQDPGTRTPMLWELKMPIPPVSPERMGNDHRIGIIDQMLQRTYREIPELRYIHPQGSQLPDECHNLFFNSFASTYFATLCPLPDYQRWFLTQDMRPAYRTYKKYLQLMQLHIGGSHWVLKCPQHLFFLDALLEILPDANIVFTHRDPVKSVGSNCSLFEVVRGNAEKQSDLKRLGRDCLAEWKLAMDRAMVVRDSADPKRFFDVYFEDFTAQPLQTVQGVYRHFGYPYRRETKTAMTSWLKKNRKPRGPKHHYSLERYGLTDAQVRWFFQSYLKHFGMAEPGRRAS